jgi:hypothetical protein
MAAYIWWKTTNLKKNLRPADEQRTIVLIEETWFSWGLRFADHEVCDISLFLYKCKESDVR